MAQTPFTFVHSECNGVKDKVTLLKAYHDMLTLIISNNDTTQTQDKAGLLCCLFHTFQFLLSQTTCYL